MQGGDDMGRGSVIRRRGKKITIVRGKNCASDPRKRQRFGIFAQFPDDRFNLRSLGQPQSACIEVRRQVLDEVGHRRGRYHAATHPCNKGVDAGPSPDRFRVLFSFFFLAHTLPTAVPSTTYAIFSQLERSAHVA